jgi:hypothetical protein
MTSLSEKHRSFSASAFSKLPQTLLAFPAGFDTFRENNHL